MRAVSIVIALTTIALVPGCTGAATTGTGSATAHPTQSTTVNSPAPPTVSPPSTTPSVALGSGLRSVNWRDVTVPGNSCESLRPIQLSDGKAVVSGGRSPDTRDITGGAPSTVSYGQLDGTNVAAIRLYCGVHNGETAASRIEDSIAVFTTANSKPVSLGLITAHVNPQASSQGSPTSLGGPMFTGGHLNVEEYIYKPTDPDCCPSGIAISTWNLVNGTIGRTATGPEAFFKPVDATGLDGKPYNLAVWAQDKFTNCAAHAYGTPMITFLNSHPCYGAARSLSTLYLGNREATLSIITIEFKPGPSDPAGYKAAEKFNQLETSSGTGALNDLLRDGTRIPTLATAIPAHESFYVTGQDAAITVFDGWWTTGTTHDQDLTLLNVEKNLFLTAAMPTL